MSMELAREISETAAKCLVDDPEPGEMRKLNFCGNPLVGLLSGQRWEGSRNVLSNANRERLAQDSISFRRLSDRLFLTAFSNPEDPHPIGDRLQTGVNYLWTSETGPR